MPNTTVYLAPAAAGKTSFILQQARLAAANLHHEVRICVPTQLQAQSARDRLAQLGGAIGIHILTFDRLVADCLDSAGIAVTELAEPVQYRLLQALVAQRPLKHYHTLTDKPGFIQVLQRLIAEWKAARLEPTALRAAFSHMGNEPRLLELADIYAAYQEELQAHNWVDRAGRYWVAAEALNQHPHAAAAWPYLYIDGFDDFTPIQRNLLELLSQRVGHLIITLTGDDRAVSRYPRFAQTRQQIEKALNIQAQPLPHTPTNRPILHHLASRLFQPGPPKPITPGPPVTLIEAADIPGEVRHALRWLKARIVQDGYHPTQVALLARDIGPYRPFIRQIAQEMGIDLRLADGSPLGQSPVIVALLDLLRLFLPDAQNQPHLPRQGVISAWRSPYFKWRTCRVSPDGPRLDLKEGDAERLDAAARYGRVIAGLDQWQEALALLAAWGTEGEDIEDEDRQAPPPRHVPTGVFAQQLRDVFERFCQRLTPPISGSFREYVSWLETLIGPDPALAGPYPRPALTSLGIVAQVRANAATEADDLAALQMFKELLRGLVWAEDALAGSTGPISITYAHFMSELLSATQAHSYRPPLLPGQPAVLIADIPQSRGLSFAAVAVLGLGEGSFPQPVREDPFLRDNDRMTLRDRFNMPVELSTQSAEREFFYELLSRGREQMLLLRPRLADTGAEWVASPFWQTIRQLTGLTPVQTADDAAASAPEWLINLAQQPGPAPTEALTWLAQQHPELDEGWHIASELFQARLLANPTPLDGDLTELASTLRETYGSRHVWSISRLEHYQTCSHFFFVSHLLKLEARPEPALGLDARQTGSLYHALFEQIYTDPAHIPSLASDTLTQFVTALAEPIFAAAPRRYGFRAAAWWSHTQKEIVENVVVSLRALAATSSDFVPVDQEKRFGLPDNPLVIADPAGSDDQLLVRGVVDRVDRNGAGQIRVIDYKLGGPASFTARELVRGRKLQLPLYAQAMQEALSLGTAVDGFYWHFSQGEPSPLTLATYEGGIEQAIALAIGHAWSAVHQVRSGQFRPHPPAEGCPSYCPAQAYCWHYRPKSWG